jgi:diaminohydroxyphosphoribosylaminopyrimidine deaminase/5-amino-6-(5-phosphoribosylamino)uracil reductase
VLVKNGRIVGEGAHEIYGSAHAEVNALKQAGAKAKGATLYVTLEPCNHQAKTPPCVDAVIAAGIKKVVAAMKDPNPLVNGRGFARLKKAGIPARSGLLEKEARVLNGNFIFSVTHGRPKVLLKAAITLDGKLATVAGRSKWITGEAARLKNHELRSRVDAVLIGSGTALKDKPRLTVRLSGHGRADGWPLKVLLDSRLRVSPKSPLFEGPQKTLVFCSSRAGVAAEKKLVRLGVLVFRVSAPGNRLSLKDVLRRLHQQGVRLLMVEGGAGVHGSFIDQRLADEVALFLAPKFFGGAAPGWIGGKGFSDPNRSPRLVETRVEPLGGDYLITGKVRY